MNIKKFITTQSMCTMIGGIKPESVHRSLSVKGSWSGLRPVKLKTGRLMWNIDDILTVLSKKY